MAVDINTYIEPLDMTLEDLSEMDAAELEAVYETALEGLSEADADALEDEIQASMDYLAEELAVQIAELENIIDSSDSSIEEATRSGIYLEDIELMKEIADEFSSDFGDAQADVAAHNIIATTSQIIDAGEGVQNGEEFLVDCTGAVNTSVTADWAEDEHPDWLDTDGDQKGDLDPDGVDHNGIADQDFNGDLIITEADLVRPGTVTQKQTITITVNPTDVVNVASYDPVTGTTRFAITTLDGITYYVTVQSAAGNFPNIKFTSSAALPSANFESLDPVLLDRIYTDMSDTFSLAHYLEVDVTPNADDPYYYTGVDMSSQDDNLYEADISDADFQNGRHYEFDFQPGVTENLTLNLPENATVDFSGNGDPFIIRVTDVSGNVVTISLNGFSLSEDILNINGGIIDYMDKLDLEYIGTGDWALFMFWNEQLLITQI